MIERFKRYFFILVLPLLIFILNPLVTKAADIKVTDVRVVDKSQTIDVQNPEIENGVYINSEIVFNKINDFVEFEITLSNSDKEEYKIYSIKDNNTNENIVVSYSSDEVLPANSQGKIKVKLSYENILKNEDKNINDLKITIVLLNENDEQEDIVIPITGDSLHINILILVLSIIVLIISISILKINNKNLMFILALVIVATPFVIFAANSYEIYVEFKNITIVGNYDVYNVTIDKDNGEPIVELEKKHGSKLEELIAPEKQGYTFIKWVDGNNNEVSSETVVKNNYVIKAIYSPNTNTQYKVEHYFENIDDTNYTINNNLTDNLTGTTDTTANAESKTVLGFTYDENNVENVKSGNINGAGDLVLKLYYTRNSHTVTYSYTNTPNGATALPDPETYKYGKNITIAANATAPGYSFNGWSKTEAFAMPDEDVIITGSFTAGTSNYKVEHYFENIDDSNYTINNNLTDNLTGTTDTLATAESKTVLGFTYDENNTENVISGNINGTGDLVLKLYYKRNVYNVSYRYTNDTIPEGATALPTLTEYKYDQTVTVANDATAPGYNFSGWSRTGTFKMPAEDVTITGSFTVGTSNYTIEHYGQSVNGDYVLLESETEHRTGTTNSHVTGAHKDIENYSFTDLNHTVYSYNPNHPDEVSGGTVNPEGTLTLKFYYNRNKYELHIINENNVSGATSGSYFYGTELTLVANERDEDDEAFTKWSDGVTDTRTRNITITEETTLGPYYHIYTVTLVDKDPRTTVSTQTELEKVDPGSSIILPELQREECLYAKDATHVTPEERECSFIAEFLGWYTDEEFTQKVESPYYPPDDITLYAKWNGVYYHYRVSGVREYSGTEGDYDDSGIVLYNLENRDRDFDISFDLIEYDESPYQQPTIMNGKFEKESLNYPGFVIRFNANNTNGWSRILVTSRWGTGASDKIEHYINNVNLWKNPPTATEPIHFKITRRDGVVKAMYSTNYSGSSIPATGVTVNLFDQNSSHTPDLPDHTPTTVTFGATIDEQGIPMRFFKGKLANIDVKMESDLY